MITVTVENLYNFGLIHSYNTTYADFQAKRKANQSNFNYIFATIYYIPDIWQNQTFIEGVDDFLRSAFEEADYYFASLEKEAQSADPTRLAAIMSDQNREPNFYTPFFEASFFQIYHWARNEVRVTSNPSCCGPIAPERFGEIDQRPFFDQQTIQYEWRQMYNTLCLKIDTLGIRPCLDAQFDSYIQPDVAYFQDTNVPWIPE